MNEELYKKIVEASNAIYVKRLRVTTYFPYVFDDEGVIEFTGEVIEVPLDDS